MATHTAQAQAHFRLIVGLFKVGIAAALELEHSDRQYLKQAFERALLEVLHQDTRSEQAIRFDQSKKTVQNTAQRTSGLPKPSRLHALLKELEQRPLTRAQLEERLPSTLEFDLPELTIQMLTRAGTLRVLADGRFTLGGSLVGLIPNDQLLGIQAEQLQLQIDIMVRLAQGACSQKDLAKDLLQTQTQPSSLPERLGAALMTLEQQGMIRIRDDQAGSLRAGDDRVWMQVLGPHTLQHPHPAVRHLTGLIDMATLLQDQLKETLQSQDRDDFGQRNFRFRALPADMAHFIERHRAEVRAALEALEARADGSPEQSRTYGFFWLISAITGPGAGH